MSGFRAILISREGEKGQKAALTTLTDADLMDGDVTVRVTHSTLNYKDGLALTGKAPIVRRWPLIPGIDFAGEVEASDNPDFKPGDRVILNGWGVGETHHGGFAGKARVKGDWLIHCPDALSNAEAMAIGTAGYTAALCVLAVTDHGTTPQSGPVVVTGAAGERRPLHPARRFAAWHRFGDGTQGETYPRLRPADGEPRQGGHRDDDDHDPARRRHRRRRRHHRWQGARTHRRRGVLTAFA